MIIANVAMCFCTMASHKSAIPLEKLLPVRRSRRYIRTDTTSTSTIFGGDMQRKFRLALLATASMLMQSGAQAQTSAGDVFNLGQIEQVTITSSPFAEAISESVVTSVETFKFNAITVDRAIDLATGAASGTTGGPRNEKLYFVRGFDRFQSPLFVDGIRVYLPADNRIDLGFFNTATLSQIQIEKGYVSVLSGPGALGGAVNLVTRKPTQSFEYEARAGAALAGDGSYNGYNSSALVGGKSDRWYWQAAGGITKSDHFKLSEDFTPTATENGGIRDHSDARNYNLNFKLGSTPNGTDEYSLSYSGQWGLKSATLSTIDTAASQRDWRWPYWDLQSLYFLSNTEFAGTASVKTKLYYNSFRNGLYSYDNANYNSQITAKAFNTYFSDYAYGGSIEIDNEFGGRDVLKGALFYRRDNHVEWQTIFVPKFTEPRQQNLEDTYSVALENRLHLTGQIDFVAGASYDWRHLIVAQDYVDPTVKTAGSFVNFPLGDGHAGNAQTALIYRYSDSGHVYANVSDRARFPTIFERFSTRFGSTLSNPNLKAERTINYELGGGDTFFGNTRFDAAVFYSDISGALENVPINFCDTTSTTAKNCTGTGGLPGTLTAVMQTQNVGDGKYYGFEFSVDSRVLDTVQAGVRYTYVNRDIDAQNPVNPPLPANFHLTGLPYSQVFAYLTWNATPQLSITPNIQAASDRWSNLTGNANVFLKTGSFVLVNLEADYAITENLDFQVGARNLFDQNYQLVLGFPSEGRSFFLNLRYRS
jgi:iron complex outermembrane receptor protein